MQNIYFCLMQIMLQIYAKKIARVHKAQKLMHDDVPSLIPAFFDLLAAGRDYVAGYQLHPRGAVFRLDHVWLTAKAPTRK